MNLVLFIPAAAARFSDQTLCSWALALPAGSKQSLPAGVAQQGNSPIAELRASLMSVAIDRVIVCLEAGRVLYVETPLPDVSTAKRNALLRYAIEDKLSADPAAIHAVIVGKSRYQAGYSIVAAIDTHWFGAMLATLVACKLSPQTVIDMPQVLRLGASGSAHASTQNAAPKIGVNLHEGAGFAVRDDGYALSFDGATADKPPFTLVLALQEFAQQRPATNDSTPVFSLTKITTAATRVNSAVNSAIDFAPWATATNQTLSDAGTLSLPTIAQTVATALAENRKPALTQMLTGAHAPASQLGGQMRLFKPAVLLASAALAVHLVYLAWDNWRLTTARDAVQSQMVQLFQKTFPDAKAIVDPSLQMQRSLDTLKGKSPTASNNDTPQFAQALADAAIILGTQAGTAQVNSVIGTSKDVKLEANVATAELANAMRGTITASYPDATLIITPASDGKQQQITLTLPLKAVAAQPWRAP